MSQYESEIKRRRTFAIISHPDAGKTTLTEKFLLYGGAIAQAGQVKGKKNTRAATSDWMEMCIRDSCWPTAGGGAVMRRCPWCLTTQSAGRSPAGCP